jgi:hypothetical protein
MEPTISTTTAVAAKGMKGRMRATCMYGHSKIRIQQQQQQWQLRVSLT